MINGGIDIFCNYNSLGVARWAFVAMTIWILLMSLAMPMVVFPMEFKNIALHRASNLWDGVFRDGCLAGIAALSLSVMVKSPTKMWAWFFIGGFFARAVRTYLVLHNHMLMPMAAFWGAVVIAFCAYFIGRRYNLPAAIFAMICVLPMIPGYLIINGFDNLIKIIELSIADVSYAFLIQTAQYLLNSLYIVAGLISGVIFPLLLMERRANFC